MAKITEILETELNRADSSQWDVVHMYRTGQFYTAYEWSAWIISVISYTDAVRMQTKDRRPLAVTRIKMNSGDETFCKVGFPFKSIEKFCPNRQDFDGVENEHITFRIPMPQPQDGSEITYERLRDAVDKWKERFEIKPPKKTKAEMDAIKAQRKAAKEAQANPPESAAIASTKTSGCGLIQMILSYPIADRTPADNIAFILLLKQQITSIL